MNDKVITNFYSLKNMLEEKTIDQILNLLYTDFCLEYEKSLIKQRKFIKLLYKKHLRKFIFLRNILYFILRKKITIGEKWILDKRPYMFDFMTITPVAYYQGDRLNIIEEFKNNISEYLWLYERLEDEASKEILFGTIMYRLSGQKSYLSAVIEKNCDQYFNKDYVKCDKNEVFVDCGGYVGDTVQKYIENYVEYKKIFVYEPSKDHLKAAMNNLKGHENIIFRNIGISNEKGVLNFNNTNTAGSTISENGGTQVSVSSIDIDISEPVTFIKMDIEGYEFKGLQGANEHIKKDSPKLAICLYHLIDDIRKIPKYIDSLNPNYRFYLRNYDVIFGETVLYAIPQ